MTTASSPSSTSHIPLLVSSSLLIIYHASLSHRPFRFSIQYIVEQIHRAQKSCGAGDLVVRDKTAGDQMGDLNRDQNGEGGPRARHWSMYDGARLYGCMGGHARDEGYGQSRAGSIFGARRVCCRCWLICLIVQATVNPFLNTIHHSLHAFITVDVELSEENAWTRPAMGLFEAIFIEPMAVVSE